MGSSCSFRFLYIDPLKQGLKRELKVFLNTRIKPFLYIDPLKQGLKPDAMSYGLIRCTVFIHRSIKTRIETIIVHLGKCCFNLFLYIDPLKQGLKHIAMDYQSFSTLGFYT